MASRSAKTAATRLVGERHRNAFYRPFYLAQSIVSFGGLVLYLRSMPDQAVWKTGPAAAAAFNSVRCAALAAMVSAVNQIGWRRITGIDGIEAWRAGEKVVPPEPEAQGPLLEEGAPISGPFNFSRHPLNFLGLPILWLRPKMTWNWLTFNVMATAYSVVGSWHEEKRLRAACGDRYIRYQKQTAFFVGRKRPFEKLPPSDHR